MRRLFSPLYWILFLLLAGIVAISLWSISSERGTVWLFEKLQALKPGMVEISGIHHSLVRGPTIERLQINSNKGQRIEIEGLNIDYQLAPLQAKTLQIRKLTVERIKWHLPPEEKSATPTSPNIALPTFELPFDITLDRLHIHEMVIERPGKAPVAIKNLSLRGAFHRNAITLDRLAFEYGHFTSNIQGNIRFSSPSVATLEGTLSNDSGDKATLRLQGRVQEYKLSGTIDSVARQHIPEAAVSIDASGDLTALTIHALKAKTLRGEIIANGKVRWRQGLEIDTSFSGSRIDPGVIDRHYSGRVNFGGQAHWAGDHLNTQLAVLGKVQGYPFHIETDADLEKQNITVRQGRLIVGSNLLKFSGSANRQAAANIHFEADMPQLSALYPPLQGKIRGLGNIDGRWLEPNIGLQLNAASLHWRDITLKSLELAIQSTGKALAANYRLTANGLRRNKLTLAEVRLAGHAEGLSQQGTLLLSDPGKQLRVQLTFDSALDRNLKHWHGTIDKALLTAFGLPKYKQRQSAALDIATDAVKLEEICLKNLKDQLCLDANLTKGQTSTVKARLEAFPLKNAKKWLPLTKYLSETIDARIELAAMADKISTTTIVKLDGNNQIAADISLAADTGVLTGNIDGRFDRLKWFDPISEDLMNPAGKLELSLLVGGIASAPEFRGQLALRNASVRLPAAGILIKDINISATTQKGKSAVIDGSLTSGKGRIAVSGNVAWPTLQQWSSNIALSGKDFLAASLPLAKVWMSPQLTITARPARIDVSGEVLIPKADIRFKRIPETAIAPSDDVYFIDTETRKASSGLKVYSRVIIRLGDKVHLSGFGLNTDLSGKLTITENPEQATSGDGSLKVVNGHYEALGQKLDIERGEIYWNGALNSPGINLRAARTTDGITTGLEISGPIQHPESRIFSDPPMDETNALAYLLTGKPLGATNQRDSNMLLNAVARLGLKGSAKLVDDLRRRTGLDVLAIQPGEELAQSAIVIGKYLSPRFYLEYTTSLFEDTSVLSMRYKLNRHLQLQAESSDKRQSIDLIYQIER